MNRVTDIRTPNIGKREGFRKTETNLIKKNIIFMIVKCLMKLFSYVYKTE